jgi:hypothetical protein
MPPECIFGRGEQPDEQEKNQNLNTWYYALETVST